MNYKGHKRGAIFLIASTIILKDNLTLFEIPMIISGIYLGSFLPDLDSDKSYLKSKLSIKFKLPLKHRGRFFHSIYTLLGISILIPISTWFLYLLIGVFGHHLLDMTTKRGLKNYFK